MTTPTNPQPADDLPLVKLAAAGDCSLEKPCGEPTCALALLDRVVRADVDVCPRCSDRHDGLRFYMFGGATRPCFQEEVATHYAACPTNEEPILLMMPRYSTSILERVWHGLGTYDGDPDPQDIAAHVCRALYPDAEGAPIPILLPDAEEP